MMVLFLLILIVAALVFLFHLLTRNSIEQAYQKLDDKNEFVRKSKAFFLGVFHLIAF